MSNYSMKTIQVKGRDYYEVKERVKKFRADFPGYDMCCDMLHYDGKSCVIKYSITSGSKDKGDYRIHAEDVAHETLADRGVNLTSFVENCSTSAIGRCLANFGIGIDKGYASADEIRGALKGEEEAKVKQNNSTSNYAGPYKQKQKATQKDTF